MADSAQAAHHQDLAARHQVWEAHLRDSVVLLGAWVVLHPVLVGLLVEYGW